MTFIYESVHYPAVPHAATSPSHLELVARLFGMRPVPVNGARVLEIGCGVGMNLMPLAERFPEARFLGIDLSASQIAAGRQVVESVGLANVELRALDLTKLDESVGKFDYVIAHGVYSWVPPAVAERLLAVVKERLAPQGVALVSHNVKPGWHHKAAMREMMLYHTRDVTDAQEKVKRGLALLESLVNSARPSDKLYRSLLTETLTKYQQVPDLGIFHDDLAEYCEASHFHEFAERMAAHGLRYLGDSHVWMMWPIGVGPGADELLASAPNGLIEREQYLDFMNDRSFRYTLMCHADVSVTHGLSSQSVADLWISASVQPTTPGIDPNDAGPVEFKNDLVTVRAHENLWKAALLVLGEMWPRPVEFGELCLRAYHRIGGPYDPRWILSLIAGEVMRSFLNRAVDLTVGPPGFTVEPGKKPRTTKLIRWQARNRQPIVAMLHLIAEMDDQHRDLLGYLDGTKDRAWLAAQTRRKVEQIDEMLTTLAKMAVIVE
jgi:SAM-dependent methyltransferase/methyltransferase-like protein